MDRVLLRFNTKFEEDPLKRTWRVLVNGVETLAEKVYINIPGETIQEDVAPGVTKFHILCYGKVHWEGDIATVRES